MLYYYATIAGVIYLALAILFGILGRNRKMGGWGYFFGTLVLTPAIGLILLMASDPKHRDS